MCATRPIHEVYVDHPRASMYSRCPPWLRMVIWTSWTTCILWATSWWLPQRYTMATIYDSGGYTVHHVSGVYVSASGGCMSYLDICIKERPRIMGCMRILTMQEISRLGSLRHLSDGSHCSPPCYARPERSQIGSRYPYLEGPEPQICSLARPAHLEGT